MRVICGIFSLLLQGVFCFLSFAATAQSAYTPLKDTLGLPNFSLISSGYETFANIMIPTGDSVPLFSSITLTDMASAGRDTFGLGALQMAEVRFEDSLIEHVDYFQNIFFDFDNGIITYIAEDKHMVDTITQIYRDPLNPFSQTYVVWCVSEQRFTICYVDFKNKTVAYNIYFEDIDYSGTFKFVNTQFLEY